MSDNSKDVNNKLLQTLHDLIRDWEHEVVEFKQASNDYSQDDVGKYFSAISNEANLKGLQHGWLVFGVNNKTKKSVGTDYRNSKGLETLKHEIADNATGRMSFVDIFEIYDGEYRIVMFMIPAAVTGIPTAWKGFCYGREGESLGPLSTEEYYRIRGQSNFDWSGQIIEGSSINHLDKDAIQVARKNYKEKQNRAHISDETDKMNDEAFLKKLRLTVDGKLTNAAMVLLGNPDYDKMINTPVHIMWRLFGSDTMVKDYIEFCIPYVTVVDQVYAKIRNLPFRYLPDRNTLFPTVTTMYDEDMLKELLNNCIAHQQYTSGGRIYLDEHEDMIVISNPGSFIPGDVRKVLNIDYTVPYYRNQLLVEVMMMLDMIDTVQMGIRKVYNIQRSRYFPMPDYDFSTSQKVAVKVYGKVLDNNYTRILFDRSDLDLNTVYLLDRVQKKLPLEKEQFKLLKQLGVVEGKAPNVYISLNITKSTDNQVQSAKSTVTSEDYYRDLIVDYLMLGGEGKKKDFMKLLNDILPTSLNDKQKEGRVKYILAKMRKDGIVKHADGNPRTGSWVLVNK